MQAKTKGHWFDKSLVGSTHRMHLSPPPAVESLRSPDQEQYKPQPPPALVPCSFFWFEWLEGLRILQDQTSVASCRESRLTVRSQSDICLVGFRLIPVGCLIDHLLSTWLGTVHGASKAKY